MATPSSPALPWLPLLLVLGTGLRLIWAADMEWKADEIWMYDTAQAIAQGRQPWPWIGMANSAGLPNPGLSVWVFAALAHLAKTPLALVRWVQGLNILALWLALAWAHWQLPEGRGRQIGLKGIALAAVSPLAILFSRKIWAQDLLPIWALLLWLGHWYRHRRWGAGVWGLLSALIGQVHMSGFFLAAAVWGWTLYHHIRTHTLHQVRWLSWLGGALLGLLPLLPWLSYVVSAASPTSRTWVALLVPKFFLHWFTTSLGVNLGYALGRHFWTDFLPWPLVGEQPTYLVAIAHALLLGLGLWGLANWGRSQPRPLTVLLAPGLTPLGVCLRAAGLGTGLLFALVGLPTPVHYLIVAFPWPFIWLASLFPDQGWGWRVILGSQVFLSIAFLLLIHQTGGFRDSDYGLVYRLSSGQP